MLIINLADLSVRLIERFGDGRKTRALAVNGGSGGQRCGSSATSRRSAPMPPIAGTGLPSTAICQRAGIAGAQRQPGARGTL